MSSEIPCCCDRQVVPVYRLQPTYTNIAKITANSGGVTEVWNLNTEYVNYNTPFNHVRHDGGYFYTHINTSPTDDLKKWDLDKNKIWEVEPDSDADPVGSESGEFVLDINHSPTLPDLDIYNKDGTFHSEVNDWKTDSSRISRLAETVDNDEMVIVYDQYADPNGPDRRIFERVAISGSPTSIWHGSHDLGAIMNGGVIWQMVVEEGKIYFRWKTNGSTNETYAYSVHDLTNGNELIRVSYAHSADIIYDHGEIQPDKSGGFYCAVPNGFAHYDSNGDLDWKTPATYNYSCFTVDSSGNIIYASSIQIGMIDPSGTLLWEHERDPDYPHEYMTISGCLSIDVVAADTYLVSGSGHYIPKFSLS